MYNKASGWADGEIEGCRSKVEGEANVETWRAEMDTLGVNCEKGPTVRSVRASQKGFNEGPDG